MNHPDTNADHVLTLASMTASVCLIHKCHPNITISLIYLFPLTHCCPSAENNCVSVSLICCVPLLLKQQFLSTARTQVVLYLLSYNCQHPLIQSDVTCWLFGRDHLNISLRRSHVSSLKHTCEK